MHVLMKYKPTILDTVKQRKTSHDVNNKTTSLPIILSAFFTHSKVYPNTPIFSYKTVSHSLFLLMINIVDRLPANTAKRKS